jgi:NADH-quinone oxidoreductase subunit C
MTPQEIQARLAARFGEAVGPMAETKRDPFFTVRADAIVEVCRLAKEVLHLFSFRHRHGVCLKVALPREAPSIPTLSGVWRAADWFEREVLDLFGVTFVGHPDPRRIMLPDDWEGYPLRKDYQEHGGWHGISNERENPLVELRRLDEQKRAELKAAAVNTAAHPERSAGAAGAESRDAPTPPTEGKG